MAKYCSNCGKAVKENQAVCLNCGFAVNNININNNNSAKSKVAAGLLGIFLGALGIHNFYLGYNNKGLGQLLLSILSCGILSPISGLWGLIEGIMILTGSITTDADGNFLSN